MIKPNRNVHRKCDARRKANLSFVKCLEARRGDEKRTKFKHDNSRIQQNT